MDPKAYVTLRATEDIHWWNTGRRAILQSVIRGLSLPDHANILEIGCGTGGNLGLLAEFGTVCGIEMEPAAVDAARQRAQPGVTIVEGSYPLPPTGDGPKGPYDLICMFDVLEHLEDDQSAVNLAVSELKPNGYFLITVPAWQFLWGPHDDYHHHKRRYHRKEVLEVLQLAGLSIIKLSYFNSLLFPPAVGLRLWERLRSNSANQKPHGIELPPRLINSILKGLFSCEKHVLKILDLPVGLSLIGCARKTNEQ